MTWHFRDWFLLNRMTLTWRLRGFLFMCVCMSSLCSRKDKSKLLMHLQQNICLLMFCHLMYIQGTVTLFSCFLGFRLKHFNKNMLDREPDDLEVVHSVFLFLTRFSRSVLVFQRLIFSNQSCWTPSSDTFTFNPGPLCSLEKYGIWFYYAPSLNKNEKKKAIIYCCF